MYLDFKQKFKCKKENNDIVGSDVSYDYAKIVDIDGNEFEGTLLNYKNTRYVAIYNEELNQIALYDGSSHRDSDHYHYAFNIYQFKESIKNDEKKLLMIKNTLLYAKYDFLDLERNKVSILNIAYDHLNDLVSYYKSKEEKDSSIPLNSRLSQIKRGHIAVFKNKVYHGGYYGSNFNSRISVEIGSNVNQEIVRELSDIAYFICTLASNKIDKSYTSKDSGSAYTYIGFS